MANEIARTPLRHDANGTPIQSPGHFRMQTKSAKKVSPYTIPRNTTAEFKAPYGAVYFCWKADGAVTWGMQINQTGKNDEGYISYATSEGWIRVPIREYDSIYIKNDTASPSVPVVVDFGYEVL